MTRAGGGVGRGLCLVVGVVVGIVVLTGCNVAARVDIALHSDGSGTLRTTITLDADAVQRMGGASSLPANAPVGDLRAAGWTISSWARGAGGSETVTLTHAFTDASDLGRRVVELAGLHGILQNPTVTRSRGWFGSHDAVGVVVDVRSPSIDILHDTTLAARLRSAGVDPALLQAALSAALRTALHLTVAVHLPDGHTQTYEAPTGTVRSLRASSGGLNWDRVVKFGIGVMLALLAGLFLVAATVGARRNRRRVVVARAAPQGEPQ